MNDSFWLKSTHMKDWKKMKLGIWGKMVTTTFLCLTKEFQVYTVGKNWLLQRSIRKHICGEFFYEKRLQNGKNKE